MRTLWPQTRSGAPLYELRKEHGLYREETSAVTFLTPTLFRTSIPLPAEVPIGTYDVEIKLFADGALISKAETAFDIVKVGFEQFVANAARNHGFIYGLLTAAMALMSGGCVIARALRRSNPVFLRLWPSGLPASLSQ